MGPWALGVPLVLVSALGLLLNAYVLLVVFGLGKQTQQQQTANTLLLIHLGAVEAAVCLVLLIFATGSWSAAGTWCVIHGFLLALLHPVALWTVTGLNCDRYYAIAAPLHYTALVSPRRVALGLAVSWTVALLLCLPPFSGLVPPYRYFPGLGCCAPDFGDSAWGPVGSLYGAAYAFLGLGLPALLVTACNLRVLGIARYHRHRIASAIYEVTLSAQVTITHQRNPFFVPAVTAPQAGGPPRFHSAASTVMQLVGSLYLLYFPYCGLILWEACGGGGGGASGVGVSVGGVIGGGGALTPSSTFHQQSAAAGTTRSPPPAQNLHPRLASLASLLLACSPPINCLLYGLKSRTLRRSVQNYWRKKATKSELQQEIQARTPSAAGSRRPSGSGPAGANPAASFFQFPPLQRRLSEALIALGNCRTATTTTTAVPGAGAFGGGFTAGIFHRARLQSAASCNTLRVPNAELERKWRHRSTESDSSTGSSDTGVWTTGVQATKPSAAPSRCPGITGVGVVGPSGANKTSADAAFTVGWPCGGGGAGVAASARRFTRVKTLEEGAAVFSAATAVAAAVAASNLGKLHGISSSISQSSDDAVTADDAAYSSERRGSARGGGDDVEFQKLLPHNEPSTILTNEELDSEPSEADEELAAAAAAAGERGVPDGEDEGAGSRTSCFRTAAGDSCASSISSWSTVEEAADDAQSPAMNAEGNSHGSTDDGLVMRPVGEACEYEVDSSRKATGEEDEATKPRHSSHHRSIVIRHQKSRGVREAEDSTSAAAATDQLRPLLTSSS